MLLCACPYGVKSEISLDSGDSASNAVVKRCILLIRVMQNVCVCTLWTSCLRAKIHCYLLLYVTVCEKLYHSWISAMTSSN